MCIYLPSRELQYYEHSAVFQRTDPQSKICVNTWREFSKKFERNKALLLFKSLRHISFLCRKAICKERAIGKKKKLKVMNNEERVYFLSKDSHLMATVRQLEYLQLFISRLSLSYLICYCYLLQYEAPLDKLIWTSGSCL